MATANVLVSRELIRQLLGDRLPADAKIVGAFDLPPWGKLLLKVQSSRYTEREEIDVEKPSPPRPGNAQ